MAPLAGKFKKLDFYKKLPSDFLEGTFTGAWISISATALISLLLLLELSSFLALQKEEALVIDNSHENELLKISFNISFPDVTCELATVDISDALGKKRMNLTKTIHKTPIDRSLAAVGHTRVEQHKKQPAYDEGSWWRDVDITKPLTHAEFQATLHRYPIVVVNFYAPWCSWCKKLEPTWDAASKTVHDKHPESTDGRIRFARVDCTAEEKLCKEHFISAFPTVRVFRKAHDDIIVDGKHIHEAYTGDRTKEALEKFAEELVASAGAPMAHKDLEHAPHAAGCNVAGFVLVKKVPGSLHFMEHTDYFSFGLSGIDLTHTVHYLFFGARPPPYAYHQLLRLHPLGLNPDWLDKLKGKTYASPTIEHSHEHYLKVVRTTVQPLGHKAQRQVDAYEYIANHHAYQGAEHPMVKISFSMSPLQVVVKELPRHWYKFLTTTCAVVGGVFTVAGILDGILHTSLASMRKKAGLGKLG